MSEAYARPLNEAAGEKVWIDKSLRHVHYIETIEQYLGGRFLYVDSKEDTRWPRTVMHDWLSWLRIAADESSKDPLCSSA